MQDFSLPIATKNVPAASGSCHMCDSPARAGCSVLDLMLNTVGVPGISPCGVSEG